MHEPDKIASKKLGLVMTAVLFSISATIFLSSGIHQGIAYMLAVAALQYFVVALAVWRWWKLESPSEGKRKTRPAKDESEKPKQRPYNARDDV